MRVLALAVVFASKLVFAAGTVTVGKVTVIEDIGSHDIFVSGEKLNPGFQSIVEGINKNFGAQYPQGIIIRVTPAATPIVGTMRIHIQESVDIQIEASDKKHSFPGYPIFEAGWGGRAAQREWPGQTFGPIRWMAEMVLASRPPFTLFQLRDQALKFAGVHGEVDRWILARTQQFLVTDAPSCPDAVTAGFAKTALMQFLDLSFRTFP